MPATSNKDAVTLWGTNSSPGSLDLSANALFLLPRNSAAAARRYWACIKDSTAGQPRRRPRLVPNLAVLQPVKLSVRVSLYPMKHAAGLQRSKPRGRHVQNWARLCRQAGGPGRRLPQKERRAQCRGVGGMQAGLRALCELLSYR
jgi:hypothetical protein